MWALITTITGVMVGASAAAPVYRTRPVRVVVSNEAGGTIGALGVRTWKNANDSSPAR